MSTTRTRPSWLPTGSYAMLAAGLALVLPLLSIKVVDGPGWLPRYALLPLEAAIGVPLLIGQMQSGLRRASIACVTFCFAATTSTLFSENPTMSFWGPFLWGNGLLFVLAMAGVWALGLSAGTTGARAVERALLVGVAVNVVIALVQVFADLSRFGIDKIFDRPTGLLGQPVQLGAFLLGGLCLVSYRASRGDSRMQFALVPVAAAIQCSGERAPFALSLGVALLSAWRQPIRPRVTVLAMVVVGLAAGFGLTHVSSNGTGVTGRLVRESVLDERYDNYLGAVDAIQDKPILGSGPGRYLPAVSPHRSERLAKALPDSYYTDAHNWPLHWAVTTGLVGLAFLLRWLWLATRRATGPLAWFAGAVAVVGLFEPHDPAMTALAMLALGAAATVPVARVSVPAPVRGLLIVCAAALSTSIVVAGWHGYLAIPRNPSEAVAAAKLWPPFPERAAIAADAAFVDERLDLDGRIASARRWARETVDRDDQEPNMLFQSGVVFLSIGDIDEAERLFRRELALDPFSAQAMAGLGAVDQWHARWDSSAGWFERSLALNPDNQAVRDRLEEVRAHLGSS